MSPLKRFLYGVDGFDAAVWNEFSEVERGQFDFFGVRIDEEDGNRLTLRHGTISVFWASLLFGRSFSGAAAPPPVNQSTNSATKQRWMFQRSQCDLIPEVATRNPDRMLL